MGAEAVLALMDATPETEACVVSLVIFCRKKMIKEKFVISSKTRDAPLCIKINLLGRVSELEPGAGSQRVLR